MKKLTGVNRNIGWGGIILTGIDRLFQELDGLLLALEGVARLEIEPAKLLENLGVTRIPLEHALVS